MNRNYLSAHSHPPPDDTVAEQIFRQNVFAKISKKPVGPLRKFYDEEVENIPDTVNFIPPSYNKIPPSLVRKRQNILPKDPKTFDEVNVQGPWALTSDGKQLITSRDQNDNFRHKTRTRISSSFKNCFVGWHFQDGASPFSTNLYSFWIGRRMENPSHLGIARWKKSNNIWFVFQCYQRKVSIVFLVNWCRKK